MTAVSCGHQFSTVSPPRQLVLSRLHLQIPARFMWEPASLTFVLLSLSAMVSTSPWTAVEPGSTQGLRTRDTSAGLSSTHTMLRSSTSEHWGMSTVQTISVACTNRSTAARIGPEFSSKDLKLGSLIWLSVPDNLNSCSREHGTRGDHHGVPTLLSIAPAAAFIVLETPARLGRGSREL